MKCKCGHDEAHNFLGYACPFLGCNCLGFKEDRIK